MEKEKTNGTGVPKEIKIIDESPLYVVLELAYYDEFLSAADVIGAYKSLIKAKRIAGKLNGKRGDYFFKGIILETTTS